MAILPRLAFPPQKRTNIFVLYDKDLIILSLWFLLYMITFYLFAHF